MANENRMALSDGSISYSEDVVATIAGLAATEVDGVAGMSGNLISGFTEMIGKKDFTKGVKAEINGSDLTLNMSVIVEYGVQIHNVCREVQENVRKAIESMTSLNPVAVNILVQGIYLEKEKDSK